MVVVADPLRPACAPSMSEAERAAAFLRAPGCAFFEQFRAGDMVIAMKGAEAASEARHG
jgi:hypothetical protein